MLVIVTEAVPDRLRGYLSRLLLEVRAGVFIGSYSQKVRSMLARKIEQNLDTGNVVIAWSVNNESGFDFETIGENRRIPTVIDGYKLVSFLPRNIEQETDTITDSTLPQESSLTLSGKGANLLSSSVENILQSNIL